MLRTKACQKRYDDYLSAGGSLDFTDSYILREFEFWRVIRNDFPYDAVAAEHHLLIPNEPYAKFYEMPVEYIDEFQGITNMLEIFYEHMGKNSPHKRTVPGWWHYHLINWRKDYLR